jgi:uncharacterized membrane protein YjjP (DUF1212 family)
MTHQLPLEVRFLKRYAKQLQGAGIPAHNCERLVAKLGKKLGFECQVMSSPTALFLSFSYLDDEDDHHPIPMQLMRMDPPSINLGNSAELYAIGNDLMDNLISAEEANNLLKGWTPRQLYPAWLQILCWGLTGGSVALMLHSSWMGAGIACVTSAFTGLLSMQSGPLMREGGLEAIAALFCTFLVFAFNTVVPGIDVMVVIMASLIVLIPGLGLTIAVTELSTQHLASGSARLAGALVTLLKLGLGVLIGTVVVKWFGWQMLETPLEPLVIPPDWIRWPALLAASFSFAVLFSVRHRDFYIAMLAAILSYVISRVGVAIGGIEFGVLLAAMCIGILSNLYGRFFRQTGALIRVPGVILLVPGTIGYGGAMGLFLLNSSDPGETSLLVFRMVIALVGGLLFGNTIVPPRKGH